MKYLILGTGGTGGCVGGYLSDSGRDVSFFARGEHLKAIKEKGLVVHSARKGQIKIKDVKAYDFMDGIIKYDVIFVCVKGYSLDEVIPEIRRASHKGTVVIPVLNSLSADEKLRAGLDGITVTGGCIYVTGYVSSPGEITQGNDIFTLVFGPTDWENAPKKLLEEIHKDLTESKIDGVLSDDIRRDVFKKFSFTSAFVASGAYFDVPAGEMQKPGECRDTFIALQRELICLSEAMKIKLNTDLLKENLKILDDLSPDTTASMQRDLKAGKRTEKKELIDDVVTLAGKLRVDVPYYKRSAEKLLGV